MSRGNGASASRARNVFLVAGMIAVFAMAVCCALANYAITGGEVGPGGVGPSAKPNTSGIETFSYSSYESMSLDGNYTYRVEVDEQGDATFYYETYRFREEGELSIPVESDVVKSLEEIYRECDIARWDGFDRYNPNVLDGGGFSLNMSFADGKDLHASGSNAWPDGFGQFERKVQELLRPYANQALYAVAPSTR